MRVQGWAEILFSGIESRRDTPFSWGSHDCCLFAADMALAITGIDYAAPVRGYTTREQAETIIALYGDMSGMVSQLLGAQPIPAASARRGDFVMARFGESDAMGVCIGARCIFAALRAGIVEHTMTVATCAWRIG